MKPILYVKKTCLIKKYEDNENFRLFWEEPDLSKPIRETTFVVVDTETTGLNIKEAELVSVGAIKVINLSLDLSETYYRIVKPSNLTSSSVEVHGITKEDIEREGRPPEEVVEDFLTFSKGTILVGFNVEFDRKILEKYTKKFFGIPIPNYRLDVFHLWKQRGGEGKSLKEIAQELDIPAVGVHLAIDDAYITALVFLKLVFKRHSEPVGNLPLIL